MACPESLPENLVPPGTVQEPFGHPLLPGVPQPEPEQQKPHRLEEDGEDPSQACGVMGSGGLAASVACSL